MTNEQTDIFGMFNLVDEAAEKKKKEAAELVAKKQAESAEREAKAAEMREKVALAKPAEKAKKPEIDVFTPNEDTVIRYYGESLDINAYFTPEELAEGLLITKKDNDSETERKPLDGEMLRKRMEKDYPELVKSHTEIIFLKEKNLIIPTMKAKKKGNCITALDNNSAFLFGVTHKIPFAILRDFIAVAKMYGEENQEVHADIYFCPHQKEFILDFPKQIVNPYWVEVTEEAYSITSRMEDAIKVLEIHSHHTMVALPSNQDNRSERVPGMHYAIVGKTDKHFPDLFLRQFISEDYGHLTKPFQDLFEDPFYQLPEGFDTELVEFGGMTE